MEAGQRTLIQPPYLSPAPVGSCPAPRPYRLTLAPGSRPPAADRPPGTTLKASPFLIGLICPAVRYVSCGSVLARSLLRCASTYYISRQTLQGEHNCVAWGLLIRVLKGSSQSARLKGRVPGADWWVRTAGPCLKSVNGGGRGAARSGGGAAAEVSAGRQPGTHGLASPSPTRSPSPCLVVLSLLLFPRPTPSPGIGNGA